MHEHWARNGDNRWCWGVWTIEHDGQPGQGAHYVLQRGDIVIGRYSFPAAARRAALRAERQSAERDYGYGTA